MSTPSPSSKERAVRPASSSPTPAMSTVGAPNRALATAWLAPLPPRPVASDIPNAVSPARGRRTTRMVVSTLMLPTTTTPPRRLGGGTTDTVRCDGVGDVAVDGGTITEVGAVDGTGRREIDADGVALRRRRDPGRARLERAPDGLLGTNNRGPWRPRSGSLPEFGSASALQRVPQ